MEALERAHASRDPRFDGRFFVAGIASGIYCRPSCNATSPRADEVRYYPSAAAATEAGFRPCQRCRPEAAPDAPTRPGVTSVVRRALELIEEGALDTDGVEALAARVGVGARHLRRLFMRYVGASPLAVAQTRRLNFAKRLVDETDLPIVQVALESGFRSLRRFSAAFREAYRHSPRELRRRRGERPLANGIQLLLEYRPPYDWQVMLDFLAARAVPEIECVRDGGYSRTIVQDGEPALVRVRPARRKDALVLEVHGAPAGSLFEVVGRARRCFDTGMDPQRVAEALGADPLLGPPVQRSPGLRIPGVWQGFECAIRAVLSQGSPEAEQRLVSRLVRSAGSRAGSFRTSAGELTHVFPTGQALATAPLEGIGLARSQVAAVRALAIAFVERRIDFDAPAQQVVEQLAALPGIDDRAAQYVALRALGDPDAFPLTGSELHRVPARARGAGSLSELAEAWRPWRGYAALHLWRELASPGRPRLGPRARTPERGVRRSLEG
jgi:AraC family transcriptional regulator of adaptative response / DNA-3-methyladenine glycosylase II